MAIFSFLHVSDLHFGAPPHKDGFPSIAPDRLNPNNENFSLFATHNENASSLLAITIHDLVNTFRSNPNLYHAIIMSGDISTSADSEDLKLAKSFVYDTVRSGKLPGDNTSRRHNGKPKPDIFLIPGNHDRLTRRGFLDHTSFENTFSAHWPLENNQKRFCQASQTFEARSKSGKLEKLVLVGADFTLDTQPPAPAHISTIGLGAVVSRTHIEELRKATKRFRDKSVAVAWVVHYPPVNDAPKWHKLDDKNNNLLALADEMKVPVILSGHLHRNVSHKMNGHGVIWEAGTACQHNAEKNEYWINIVDLEVVNGEIIGGIRMPIRLVDGRREPCPTDTFGSAEGGQLTFQGRERA